MNAEASACFSGARAGDAGAGRRVCSLPPSRGPDAVVVDATVGLGGHSAALLARFDSLQLVGLDRDQQALALATQRLAPFAPRATLVHAVYDELAQVLADLGRDRVQGVLFDLGVSSLQLDDRERGFAYAQDAPLDMRMDQSRGLTAADVVNTYDAARPGARTAQIWRGALRAPHRRRRRPRARDRAVHRHRAAGRAGAVLDPGRHPAQGRSSGQAHVPGAAHRGERRARFVGAGAARRGGGPRGRRAHRRAVLSLARGPVHQAAARLPAPRARPRRTCRSSPRRNSRPCGCSPAAPRCRTRPRSPATRAPPRPSCAPPSDSGTRHEHRHARTSSSSTARSARVQPAAEAGPHRWRAARPSRPTRAGPAGPAPRRPGAVRRARRVPAGRGLGGLLFLHTALAEDSFRLHDLQVHSALLDNQQQALEQTLALEASPQAALRAGPACSAWCAARTRPSSGSRTVASSASPRRASPRHRRRPGPSPSPSAVAQHVDHGRRWHRTTRRRRAASPRPRATPVPPRPRRREATADARAPATAAAPPPRAATPDARARCRPGPRLARGRRRGPTGAASQRADPRRTASRPSPSRSAAQPSCRRPPTGPPPASAAPGRQPPRLRGTVLLLASCCRCSPGDWCSCKDSTRRRTPPRPRPGGCAPPCCRPCAARSPTATA